LSSSEEDEEEEEGKQRSQSSGNEDDGNSGGGQGQNDRSDRRWMHEQWCRGSDDGIAMLANGTEVASRGSGPFVPSIIFFSGAPLFPIFFVLAGKANTQKQTDAEQRSNKERLFFH